MRGILAILYSDFISPDATKIRNDDIRRRHTDGERISDLAHEFGISVQRVYQIVNLKRK